MEDANAVAIVGMAGRFPGAGSVAEYWKNLLAGTETLSRWDDVLRGPRFRGVKGEFPDATTFRPELFGINEAEARIMDPQIRKLLELSWEALDDAGIATSATVGSNIGVYVTSATSEHMLAAQTDARLRRDLGQLQVRLLTDREFAATRVSYHLNLTGPAMTIQTACSSSLVAVHQAVTGVLLGETDVALAGGVAIDTTTRGGYDWVEGGIGSRQGRLRPFDTAADGAIGGNGAGVVVLKRLDQAIQDGDHVYAAIVGSAVSNDGNAKVGFTAPSVDGHAHVIRNAWEMAEESPRRMDYFEGHGTGTALGDPIEIAALAVARQNLWHADSYEGDQPTVLGSVKGNIGHLDTAAGVASIIKAALIAHHRTMVATPGLEHPDPRLDLSERGLRTITRAEPVVADEPLIGISSLGIGGTNAHVVVRGIRQTTSTEAQLRARAFPVSAYSEDDAAEYVQQLADRIESERPDLGAAASTLQSGRRALGFRAVVVAEDSDALVRGLRATSFVETPSAAPRFAILFPGQTSYVLGAGEELARASRAYAQSLERSARVLLSYGIDPRARVSDPLDTRVVQPTIVSHQIALVEALAAHGLVADEFAGHSLGEYSALVAQRLAGAEDVLIAVAERARLMSGVPEGRMIAVRASLEDAERWTNEGISLAAHNGEDRVVLSGGVSEIGALVECLREARVAHLAVKARYAFHSSSMDSVLDEMEHVADRLVRAIDGDAASVWNSSVSGGCITVDEIRDPGYWVRQLRATVRWHELAAYLDERADVVMECGSGGELTGMSRMRLGSPPTVAVQANQGRSETAQLLHAVGFAWSRGAKVIWSPENEVRMRVSLPGHPLDGRDYGALHLDNGIRNEERSAPAPSAARSLDLDDEPVAAEAACEQSAPTKPHAEPSVRDILVGVLGAAALDEDRSFLASGGDSLAAVQVVARIQDTFERAIDMSDLLLATHLSEFIAMVERDPAASVAGRDSGSLEELLSSFDAEERP